MKYSTQTGTLSSAKTPCLVTSLKGAQRALSRAAERDALKRATQDFSDEVGKTLTVILGSGSDVQRVLIAGGCDDGMSTVAFRRAAASAADALVKTPVSNATSRAMNATRS